MEHEVYVPFPVRTVRQALTDAERVARCVPGVQLDADAAPQRPQGRLRLRVGSSTITYRGTLTVGGGPADDDPEAGGAAGPVTVEAAGTETRGEGTVALTLTVRCVPATEPGPGTALVCDGTVRSEGRLAAAGDRAAAAAGRRLLDRFAENLAADLGERPVEEAQEAPGAPEDAEAAGAPDGPGAGSRPVSQSIFDTEVPPPSLDPLSDAEDDVSVVADPDDPDGQPGAGPGADEDADAERAERLAADDALMDGFAADGPDALDEGDGDAPAEAAHARRTMIGRSAEEVDHAPPRGRYAPVPAPETGAGSVPLRWAAPAAAVVLASAVVVGRVLRRRR
ncbi:carbon monoxide dehydrogenase subunit G [Streptomyces sp. NRRL F-4489]|uniref:SRPBCC domain-containing protein n=1 Tax=Streptomyces sp. NRRL F-4489 TaxID=1609095 RepID=UPI000749493C|nr:SRPBCC domain-containing protein [Streptomyces sp. NRRL F-4489]KUL50194.1 carbon monoxide dehydrogenase subunit G [Streptomyces sp. NRRL F-4489]